MIEIVEVNWFSVGDGFIYEFWPEDDLQMQQQIFAKGLGWA